MGEPSGVGADVIIGARSVMVEGPPVYVIGDPDWLAARAARIGSALQPKIIAQPDDALLAQPHELAVFPLTLPAPSEPGRHDHRNAQTVITSIETAFAHVYAGDAAAMVTAPIAKAPLYDAGFQFPGHTEFIGALCAEHFGQAADPMMLLESRAAGLRVALATIHVPLADAPGELTTDGLVSAARRLDAALRSDFAVSSPRIAVAGLNPHAGESGAIGREEVEIIAPAIAAMRAAGIAADGPAPADTLFHAEARAQYDAVLCLYHDQGLIPLKTLDFYGGVNVTLNLPIIRTSPDHGTAPALAGVGRARADSMIAALRTAWEIAQRRASAP